MAATAAKFSSHTEFLILALRDFFLDFLILRGAQAEEFLRNNYQALGPLYSFLFYRPRWTRWIKLLEEDCVKTLQMFANISTMLRIV